MVVKLLLDGPWASVGVQEIRPLELMVAPAGPVASWYVSGRTGTSASVAVFVTARSVNSVMVRSGWAANAGPIWSTFTVTLNVLVSARCLAFTAFGLES